MDRLSSAARRRTLDPHPKPENGLAEWTSKIKDLQRQVDEDKEAETRILQEEIQASRLARLRRSAGYSQAGSIDLSNSGSERETKADESPLLDSGATPSRQENQENALRKLMGERGIKADQVSKQPRMSSPAAPMSLAAFIGGRATGPKLTRHAPQQDAHDPTQFEQRTHITSPHPIFGRGGIAMPGMIGRHDSAIHPGAPPESRETLATVSNHRTGRNRKMSTPSLVKSLVQQVEAEAVVAHKTGSLRTLRQRTISTPTTPVIDRSHLSHDSSTTPSASIVSRQPSLPPSPQPNATTVYENSPVQAHSSPLISATPMLRSHSALSTSPPISPTSASPKPSITTPSLARPIQPSPRRSLGPQIPITSNPSPAFLKATPPKEPTPSISRLQGRGFVRSMVQATSQFASASPSTSPLPEKRNSGSRKHSSPVLERWQNSAGTSSPSPPIVSPKPIALRKSHTEDPPTSPSEYTAPKLVKSDYTGRSVRSAVSASSLHHSDAHTSSSASDTGRSSRPHTPGLGSSKTTISYIKPIKTGDRPRTASPPPRSRTISPEVDELGMRVRSRSKSREAVRAHAAVSTTGTPLNHLTKDRAKKPRKTRRPEDGGRRRSDIHVRFAGDDEQPSPAAQPESASLSDHKSTELVPDVVVSLPLADASNATEKALSTASPQEAKFDDTFTPPLITPSTEKRPALASVLVPTSSTTTLSDDAHRSTTPSPRTPSPAKEKPPSSPARHARIPSTGNRATVMDVAQAFFEKVSQEPPVAPPSAALPSVESESLKDTYGNGLDDISPVTDFGTKNDSARPEALGDKRKSSFERYAAIAMPPLEEERTPVASPVGTLAHATNISAQEPTVLAPEQIDLAVGQFEPLSEPRGVDIQGEGSNAASSAGGNSVHVDCVDEAFPEIDVAALLNANRAVIAADVDKQTISVDVMSIMGSTASNVARDMHIFYDTEFLAIIHRVKSRLTGLVSTDVWSWRGKRCTVGEREERKIQELARRYGTSLVDVYQYCETEDLVTVLGGQLVTRQGTRAHWSAENTAMHLIRSIGRSTFIDELDLSVKNLCSGFSYCLSLLDTIYVWYGCGSLESERRAARDYATVLASSSSAIVELREGEDEDEMFWMILGDGDYAKADYWKWKTSTTNLRPRVWSVDVTKGRDSIISVLSFANYSALNNLVHIIDCVWEFFILVGSDARGKRQDIRLALSTAVRMANFTASSRPFVPTVHALILPSQLPTDLRLNFRDMDESVLNCGNVPDHMNLISIIEAEEHMKKNEWEKAATQDPTMLPLGVHTSDLL